VSQASLPATGVGNIMKAKQNMTLEDIIANGEDSQVKFKLDEIHPNQLAGKW